MSLPVADISDIWGDPCMFIPVPDERFEKYGDNVPDFLLDIWKAMGYSGFQDGLIWLCDPDEWQPMVDAWTAGFNLPSGPDEWLAVARSAFGSMLLWGRRSGMSLTILPYLGWIVLSDCSNEMSNNADRDGQIYASLVNSDRESLDVPGDDGKLLFEKVLKSLGPVGARTMYGFVPAPALGGLMLPENVEIVDAEAHIQVLSDVTPRAILADDPSL